MSGSVESKAKKASILEEIRNCVLSHPGQRSLIDQDAP